MSKTPPEPPRISDLGRLVPYVRARVEVILAAMKDKGFDPIPFETLRTKARQNWLYGIGRDYALNRRPITWTHNSRHLVGKACDIVSKSKHWNASNAFWQCLADEAEAQEMHTIPQERCHLEYR